ncbi:MAG: endonuclease/exonuclease/phosphatase family protein, partial [Saprospiraceae bacterium]
MSLFKKSLLLAHVLLTATTLLAYLTPSVDPIKFWPLSIIGLFMPWLLLLQIVFFVYWIYLRKWYSLISVAVWIIGWPLIQCFVNLNSTQDISDASSFSVMSYNVHYLQGLGAYSARNYQETKESIVPFLKEQGPPSILCAQESHQKASEFLRKSLDYQYTASNNGAIFNTIFSKLPIRKSGEINLGSSSSSGIWADIEFEKETYRVFNIHLESNRVSQKAQDLMTPDDVRQSLLSGFKFMFRRYRNAARKRSLQAREIEKMIQASPHKVIVCGDFNDPPQSYAYGIISKGLSDAFEVAGSGIGTTYGGIIPGLKIDYILTDPSLDILDHRILKEKYSDHYPVISNI